MEYGERYNLDPRFVASIMGAETTFGKNITAGVNNLFNNLYNGLNSPFDSVQSSIYSEFKMIGRPGSNYQAYMQNTSDFYGIYCRGNCSNG